MTEEDNQRLFAKKVNKTFSECLNLINEGWSKETVVTRNDLEVFLMPKILDMSCTD